MEKNKLLKRKTKAISNGDTNALVSASIDLAASYMLEGHHEGAINEYENAADLYLNMGKILDYARMNRMIGEAYVELNDYTSALKYQQIHLDVATELEDALEKQRALATIGHIHLTNFMSSEDKTDKTALKLAHKAFIESLNICEKLTGINKQEKMDMSARLFANLGVIEECQEHYEKGIELLQRSINICKNNDLFEQLERGHTSLGSLFVRKGDFHKAIAQYNLAIEVASRLEDKQTLMCTSLLAKAGILFKLSDFQGAKHVLMKAYKLKSPNKSYCESVEHHLKIVTAICYAEDSLLTVGETDYKKQKELYEKLGDGACALNIYPQAIEYYKKMLETAKKNNETGKELSPSYISLAQTYSDNKQYDLAIKYFQLEYNVCKTNSEDSVNTLLNILINMEFAGKVFEELENLYKKALTVCAKINDKKLEAKVLKQYVAMLRKYYKNEDAALFENKLSDLKGAYSESDSESLEEINTPNIGDDICIEDITDISDGSDREQDLNKPRITRKQLKGITVKKNNKGESQLHVACIKGNVILVRRLLEQGHPVNVRDYCGWSPLHEACNFGHTDIVNMLLDKGAHINDRGGTSCNGMTPLHDACSNGHLKLIELLLDRGASAIAKNDCGETPSHYLKTYYKSNKFDSDQQIHYDSLMQRMTTLLEKSLHKNKVLNVEDFDKIDLYEKSTLKNEQKPNKAIGNLRRNVVDDLDLNVPSTSRYTAGCSSYLDRKISSSSSEDNESTAFDYRQVMENLRHRSVGTDKDKKRKSSEISDKPAYLEPDEVTVDEWLEDDLQTNIKKQKISTSNAFITTAIIHKEREPENRSFSRNSSKSSIGMDQDLNLVSADEVAITLDSEDEFVTAKSIKKVKRKHQISLIDAGFMRTKTSPNTSPFKQQVKSSHLEDVSSVVEADATTYINRDVTNCRSTASTVLSDPIVSIDVRIEGRLYRVPLRLFEIHTHTIKWLAEEAANRYCRKECTKPSLELETMNGVILGDDDLVAILFPVGSTQAEKVNAKVLTWVIPSLFNRYKENCSNSNLEPNERLSKILSETSPVLNLHNFMLRNKKLAPLCKALNHQNNLFHLDLSGNLMLDECVQLLCRSLTSLNNLSILNLSSNELSVESIRCLAGTFLDNTIPILTNLVELNLSYNPLGDESLKHLAVITTYLKLTNLQLVNVQFTSNVFNYSNKNIELCFEHLENLNISSNLLKTEQLKKFVSWLNPNKVQILDIGENNLEDDGLIRYLSQFFLGSGNVSLKIKSLYLSRCGATDSSLYDLLRALVYVENFENFDLAYNSNLTAISLRRLLQHNSSFTILNLIGCQDILKYFNDCTENTWTFSAGLNTTKTLRLSIEYTVNQRECDILINMWKKHYRDDCIIITEVSCFLELSVKD